MVLETGLSVDDYVNANGELHINGTAVISSGTALDVSNSLSVAGSLDVSGTLQSRSGGKVTVDGNLEVRTGVTFSRANLYVGSKPRWPQCMDSETS